MARSLDRLTEALLEAARKAGADSADATAVEGASIATEVRQSRLEQAIRSEGVEIGLRVLIGQRQATVSATDISDRTIAVMAERAVAMAREAPEDPHVGLADPGQLARHWTLDALEMADDSAEPDAAVLQADALASEAAAMASAGITQVEAAAGYYRQRVHFATTNGFAGGYGRTARSISASAFTGEGTAMEHDWAAESRVFQADLPGPEVIGALAAERALARAGARRPKTGAWPVLYDERVASTLVSHLLAAVNGSAIARGASWARDLLGRQVLPAALSLVEDPLRPRSSRTRPFDDEGLPSQRRVIVEDGVLMGWTLDLATGRKLGMESTANAERAPGSAPWPATTNIDLTQGPASRADLIRNMGTGLLITSLIGSTINPNTGDYSRGASGFWVENGEITHAVNEVTVAGNLRDMLLRLTAADDAQPHRAIRVPSLLVEGLTLAGA